MAKEAKKDPQELTVEQKLKALFQLQTMLSKIDEIKTLRGELPLEVQDLEDEIAGLSTRIERIQSEVSELKSAIATKRVEIETAKASVAKYKEQQENVRNNREYDFLSKEIEFQTLEIELCEKRIKEFTADEEVKSQEAAESIAALEERQKDLDVKKNELDEIISETKQEERKAKKTKPKISKQKSNRVCSSLSSVSAKIHATVWASFMYSVMPAVVASTKFHLKDNWTSVHVRKSLFANIADVS